MQKYFKKGLYFALITALISGIANFLNKYAVAAVGDSFVFTTAKNILVALLLSSFMLLPLAVKQLKQLKKKHWLQLMAVGLVGGSLPFVLFFKGLTITSAVQASFIHKTLFIWVTVLAIPLLKEKFTKWQGLAMVMLLGGSLFLGGLKTWQFGWGDLLIFLATLLWAAEYIIAKSILKTVNSSVVAWARMFFGSLVLLTWLLLTRGASVLFRLNSFQWSWTILMSLFLLGFVLTWYAALKRQPASVVTSILVLAFPVTAILSGMSAGTFGLHQLAGVLLISFAVILIYNIYNVGTRRRLVPTEEMQRDHVFIVE